MSIPFGENAKPPYTKIWKIEDKGRCVKANASTSRKNGEEYINSSWNITFLGSCVEKAKTIEVGDVIMLHAGSFSNTKSKTDGKYYLDVAVFAFEFADGSGEQSTTSPRSKPVNGTGSKKSKAPTYEVEEGNEEDEDLPF